MRIGKGSYIWDFVHTEQKAGLLNTIELYKKKAKLVLFIRQVDRSCFGSVKIRIHLEWVCGNWSLVFVSRFKLLLSPAVAVCKHQLFCVAVLFFYNLDMIVIYRTAAPIPREDESEKPTRL